MYQLRSYFVRIFLIVSSCIACLIRWTKCNFPNSFNFSSGKLKSTTMLKTTFLSTNKTLLALILLLTQSLNAQIYVNVNTPCTANCDGSSWDNAFADLQDALEIATANDFIWVATGTYNPHPSDRTFSFFLIDGIELYGGFAGNETEFSQRDVTNNPTILSGDLNGDDEADFVNFEDNSFTIIHTENVGRETIVDGFTIRGGYSNDINAVPLQHKSGGGWYNVVIFGTNGNASPTIRNCIFLENYAELGGGGMFNSGDVGLSETVFENCVFEKNDALIGGGIYNSGNGGLCFPVIYNTVFKENNARETGGGIYNFALNGGDTNPVVANSSFIENTAVSAAGYYSLTFSAGTSASILTNCLFYGNFAAFSGGAVYLNTSEDGICTADILNSIFWGTTGDFDPHFHYSGLGLPEIHLSYSIVDAIDCDALIAGDKSIDCLDGMIYDTDPLFTDEANKDFHLQEDSPAIDVGNSLVPDTLMILLDIDQENRIQGDAVDIGIDEFLQDTVFTGITSLSAHKPSVVFPNPAKDYINIIFNESISQAVSYKMYDWAGKIVLSGSINLVNGTGQIAIASLNSGIYYISVGEQLNSIRFIKQATK